MSKSEVPRQLKATVRSPELIVKRSGKFRGKMNCKKGTNRKLNKANKTGKGVKLDNIETNNNMENFKELPLKGANTPVGMGTPGNEDAKFVVKEKEVRAKLQKLIKQGRKKNN